MIRLRTYHQEHGHCAGGQHEGCDHHHHHHHHHDESQPPAEQDKTLALLSYMVDHNAQHTQEIVQMAGQLEAAGHGEQAALLREGVACYNEGNEKLAAALKAIKGE